MKLRYFLTAIGCLILATGCADKKQAKQPAAAGGPTPEIDVAEVRVDSVTLHRTFPGYIRANNSVDVVARVSGKILSRNYTEGGYVTKGQVLFTIEDTKYRDAVQQAQAALSTAQSQREFYSKQYAAMQKALQSDAVSQMEVNQSRANLQQAEASIRNASAAIESAKSDLGYCIVRAPISGHITEETLDVGSYVDGGMQAVKLATIYDDGSVDAEFSIESAQYEDILQNSTAGAAKRYANVPLDFNVPLKYNYTADLYYASPAVDTSTGTMMLKGAVANKGGELKDGMFVSVDLPYGFNPNAILVKDASIGTDQLGKYVYVVDGQNKVVYTPIEVGELYQDSLRIVNKGLNPGDRYVTKALLTVRNGETVKPKLTNS